MFIQTAFVFLSAALGVLAAPTEQDTGNSLSRRCFSNGGGWYWCALDETPTPQTREFREVDAELTKRCFSNGGGWYWCALDAEPATVESRSLAQDVGMQKRCFSNGGGWYWCALDESPSVESREVGMQKRCFSNGGGWYWCALDETPSVESRDVGMQKRCFSNGGGWYWCALDETPSVETREVSEEVDLQKRCFSNGGGWYWCALDETPEASEANARRELPSATSSFDFSSPSLFPSSNFNMIFQPSDSFPMSGPEADANWSALFPPGGGFLQFNKTAPLEGFSMFHGLHCLNSVRMALEAAFNVSSPFARQFFDAPDSFGHLQHCLTYIRQSLLCAADSTLEPESEHTPGGVAGNGVPHMCRDPSVLYDAAEKFKPAKAPGSDSHHR